MARSSRAIPYLLLFLLAVLTGGAAVAGILATMTPAASLQAAANRTLNSPGFTFRLAPSDVIKARGSGRTITTSTYGVYQAPDRWNVVTISGSYRTSLTAIGPDVYRVIPYQRLIRLAQPSSISPSYGWVPILDTPPFDLLNTARNVTKHGDTYSFKVPSIPVPFGWVAYAPLSGAINYPPPLPSARDTPAVAVVHNGYLASIAFPDGITNGVEHVRPVKWIISDIGAAPAVLVPS